MRYRQTTKHLTRHLLLLSLICLPASFLVPKAVCAEEVQQPAPIEKEGENGTTAEKYVYQLEERPDPFVPFITQKAMTSGKQPDPNEIVEEEKILTGMQLFEPGQLTLTAIMLTNQRTIAMVEDVTGMGYVLEEGILIGRRGVVTRIDPGAVIITETTKTRAGKEIFKTITMKLNKEGDE